MKVRSFALTALVFVLFSANLFAQTAGVTRDVWAGRVISNMQSLADNPAYLGTPTTTSVMSSYYEGPLNSAGRFVARYVSRVTAPTTGNYFFWIACNYKCMLWLSPTETFNGSAPIARMMQTIAPSPRQWTRYAEQRSVQIALAAGQSYYLLAIQQEDGDNINHLSVGWWYPTSGGTSGVYERPIPASRTATYNYPATFTFSANPAVVDVNGTTTLSWATYGYTSCTGNNDKGLAWSGTQPLNGSSVVTIAANLTHFTLTCTGPPGTQNAVAEVNTYFYDQVSIAWDRNLETDITNYKISYGLSSGGPYTQVSDAGNVTEYRLPSFSTAGRYYFVVQAQNAGGISPYSSEVYADIQVSQTLNSSMTLVSAVLLAPATTSTTSSSTKPPKTSGNTGSTTTSSSTLTADSSMKSVTDAPAATTADQVPTVRYFAEGANSDYFHTEYVLFNPNSSPVTVQAEFQLQSGNSVVAGYEVPARGRLTVDTATIPELSKTLFAATLSSDNEFAAERKLTSIGVGISMQGGANEPKTDWYLAEGATGATADLYYLIQNSNGSEATVGITFLLPDGSKIRKNYRVPPMSRQTLAVDGISGLTDTQPSAIIASDLPIVVERAMYLSGSAGYGGTLHSAAVSPLSNSWHFAEGGTGSYFDLKMSLLNPHDYEALVRVRYLLTNRQEVVRDYVVPAGTKKVIKVDDEDPVLANVAVSMTIDSSVPIAAERTMAWSSGNGAPVQLTNAGGAVAAAAKWAIAESEVGGTTQAETLVSILNLADQPSYPSIKLVYDDGTSDLVAFEALARARTSVDIRNCFAAAVNRRFSIVVEDANRSAQLVVDATTYRAAGNRLGALTGTSRPAVPIR